MNMSPLRSRLSRFEKKHPNTVILLVIGILLFNTIAGTLALYEIHDQQDQFQTQARNFAHVQCTTSNDARESLKDLLVFIEKRSIQIQKQEGATQEQIDQTMKFYRDAIARITFIDCPEVE